MGADHDEESRFHRLCEVNVEMQVRRLAATPIVENAWARGRVLHLHGWLYGMDDGLIRDLGPHLSSREERDTLPSIDDRVRHPVEPRSALRRQAEAAFAATEPVEVASSPCSMPPIDKPR